MSARGSDADSSHRVGVESDLGQQQKSRSHTWQVLAVAERRGEAGRCVYRSAGRRPRRAESEAEATAHQTRGDCSLSRNDAENVITSPE